MKRAVLLLLSVAAAQAQIVRPVQHTNGVLVAPTNFWTANAAPARAGLGIEGTWLTNTNINDLRTAFGLGPTNNVAFNSVAVGDAALTRSNLGLVAPWLTNDSRQQLQVDIFTTNRAIYSGGVVGSLVLYSAVATWASGTWVLSMPLDVLDPVGPGLPSYKAMTRSNLGLGATWLTNVAAPIFWTSVPSATNSTGSAGQVAYTNNYLYNCVASNTWRRVQLGTW